MKTMYYHRKKFFFIPLIALGLVLFGYVTMLLWNMLMPVIFNVTAITFWQAVGMIVLTRLLFGGFHNYRNSGWSSYQRDRTLHRKIHNMSPEERREFFRKMHYDRKAWYTGHEMGNEGSHDHAEKE